mgnify:CR=1 FL=1
MRMKRHRILFEFEGKREGRKRILSIDAEILQVTPEFHLAETKKSSGDKEYLKR